MAFKNMHFATFVLTVLAQFGALAASVAHEGTSSQTFSPTCMTLPEDETEAAFLHGQRSEFDEAARLQLLAASHADVCASSYPDNLSLRKRQGEFLIFAGEYTHAKRDSLDGIKLVNRGLKLLDNLRTREAPTGELIDETLWDVRRAKNDLNGRWPLY